MCDFGKSNPRDMPPHFFMGVLSLDYDSAVRADISKQNCSICPRYWYLNAFFRCDRCERKFCFTAEEQKYWYETLEFWVDAFPRKCPECRKILRSAKALRIEYDRNIAEVIQSNDIQAKRRLAEVIDQLYETAEELPDRINEKRKLLAKQIDKFKQV